MPSKLAVWRQQIRCVPVWVFLPIYIHIFIFLENDYFWMVLFKYAGFSALKFN